MKNLLILLVLIFFTAAPLHSEDAPKDRAAAPLEWKVGISSVVITPDESMWMAGYGFRDRPSEGTRHDLWAKALAFEDANGHQGVLITTDLLGFPKEMSDTIRNRIEENFGLSRAQVILNSSHTHTGPVLENALVDIYPLDDQQKTLIARYSRHLEDRIVELVGEALRAMEPARIYAGNGVTRFAVNRRNNPAAILHQQTELKGPTDYAVPVLSVKNSSGDLIAVAFGYACHTTSISDYKWSGDYAGFAQLELEEAYPGVKALFFQGAGADQNPLPRGTIELAEQYGRSLAVAVQRVLKEEMNPLPAQLFTAYSEVELGLTTPPTHEELVEFAAESSGYPERWANRMIEKLDSGESFIRSYPFPVQAWNLGGQPVFTLGGELVADYAIELKRIFGYDTFVMGYTNDVMSYIPSARILREGGYEGETSQMVYGMPSVWRSDIETLILNEILKVAEQAEVPVW